MHERININHIMWRLIEIDNNSSKLSNNFACRAYMVRESVYVVLCCSLYEMWFLVFYPFIYALKIDYSFSLMICAVTVL